MWSHDDIENTTHVSRVPVCKHRSLEGVSLSTTPCKGREGCGRDVKAKGNRAPVRFTLNSAEQTPKPLERYLKTKGLPVPELCFSFALTPLRKVTLYSGQHGVWLCCWPHTEGRVSKWLLHIHRIPKTNVSTDNPQKMENLWCHT